MAEQQDGLTLAVGRLLAGERRATASAVPEGLDALVRGEIARQAGAPILHVARDGNRLATLEETIPFFAPDVQVLVFPAWDGVPYDRVAPNGARPGTHAPAHVSTDRATGGGARHRARHLREHSLPHERRAVDRRAGRGRDRRRDREGQHHSRSASLGSVGTCRRV